MHGRNVFFDRNSLACRQYNSSRLVASLAGTVLVRVILICIRSGMGGIGLNSMAGALDERFTLNI